MRQHLPIMTITTTKLYPQIHQLILDASHCKLRVTIVEEDGRQIAEIWPIDVDDQEDIWAGYDPEAARKAWRESAGILVGVDIDALLADLKAERE